MGTVGVQLTTALNRKFTPSEQRCYLGDNFVRAFRTVLDSDTDRLFCKDAGTYVELEVASLATEPSAVAAIGLADATDL